MQDMNQNQGGTQPAAPTPSKGNDVNDNKALAAISYLFILSFIMYFVKKDSPFVQFHAKQAMMIAIINIVIWIIAAAMAPFFLLGSFGLIMLLNGINWVIFIIAIIGLIMAAQGKRWKIPVIGDMAFKLFGPAK